MADANAGILIAVAAGAAVTYFWRGLGVALARRIDPAGPVFQWVGCVAYALIAALVARMILLPIGPLQETLLPHRLAGCAAALLVYVCAGRSVLLAASAGVGLLVVLNLA